MPRRPPRTRAERTLPRRAVAAVAAAFAVGAALVGPRSPARADAPPPEVLAVVPVEGPAAGGTRVEVTGSGFGPLTRLFFGGVAAPCYTVESSGRIVATTPAFAPGRAEVTVRHVLAGASPTIDEAGFTYLPADEPPLAVDALRTVASGPAGGTSVVVTGHGFCRDPALSVMFGDHPSPAVDVRSDGELIAAVPVEASAGTAPVTLATSRGRTSASPAAAVTFDPGAYTPPTTVEAGPSPPPAGPSAWARCEAGAGTPTCPPPLGTPRLLAPAVVLDPPSCRTEHPPSDYPCGHVLIAGGEQGFCELPCTPLDSVELYDPATARWRKTTAMAWPKGDFTLTLLDDGRVLAVGGSDGRAKAEAELYDPRTEAWSPAGRLSLGRFAHTATRLDGPACTGTRPASWCGKVLVTGGSDAEISRAPFPTAELFDPASGLWSPVDSMGQPRANHTATLLPSGQVLVTGGIHGRAAQRSAELFDPASATWRPTGDLAVPRVGHTATLIGNGEVLVIGGLEATHPPTYVRSAERYDAATGRWTPTRLPHAARAAHTASLLPDGRVVVVGGGPPFRVPSPPVLSSVETYDARTDRWTDEGSLHHPRTAHSAVVLDGPACRHGRSTEWCGRVLVAGGGSHATDAAFAHLPTRMQRTLDETLPSAGVPISSTELSPCSLGGCRPAGVSSDRPAGWWPLAAAAGTALAAGAGAAWAMARRRRGLSRPGDRSGPESIRARVH